MDYSDYIFAAYGLTAALLTGLIAHTWLAARRVRRILTSDPL